MWYRSHAYIRWPQVQLQTTQTPVVDEDIVQDDANWSRKKNLWTIIWKVGSSKMIIPLSWMMMKYSMTRSEEELINENEIDIPDIENEELIEDDDNDFLVEEDEIEDSDLIITPKSDDE